MLCGELPLPLVAGMLSACLLHAAVTQKAAHSPSISTASQLHQAGSSTQASTKAKVCACVCARLSIVCMCMCVRKKGFMCVCVCVRHVPCLTRGASTLHPAVTARGLVSTQAPRPPPQASARSDTHAPTHTTTTISHLIPTLHQVTLPRRAGGLERASHTHRRSHATHNENG